VLEFDLTQSHAIQDHIQAALKLFGHIDLLINNAGNNKLVVKFSHLYIEAT
jgi:NADP-dependent 3-hydroxy acid dehydrogenase YdfG